jgi:hypothetical protein
MTMKLTAQTSFGAVIAAASFCFPMTASAHTLDICAPQVTMLEPDSVPAGISPRSFTAQAALFLDRVSERDLRKAVEGVPAEKAVPATYLFNGPDTRWRLKSPLSHKENVSNGIFGLSDQLHYLVPSALTKPYGTIVVTGSNDGPGVLTNPSMVAHLADGRGVIIEPHDLDANCRLNLDEVVEGFLEGIAYYMDHHHHDEDHQNLRDHSTGRYNDQAKYPGDGAYRSPAHPIPEYDAGRRKWNWNPE